MNIIKTNINKLTSEEKIDLLKILESRFKESVNLGITTEWNKIQTKLEANPSKLLSLYNMEITSGEPNVID